MRLFPGSIKGRLFLWYSAFTSLLLILLSIIVFFEVKRLIFASVDQSLHSKMQLTTGLMHEEDDDKKNDLEIEIEELKTGEFAVPRSGHYYKVIVDDGRDIIFSPSLVDPNFNLAAGDIVDHDEKRQEWTYMSKGPDNEPIRVLRHDLRYLGRNITVFIAEDVSFPLKRIESFRLYLLLAVPLAILFTSLVGIWIIGHSLKPLRQFCYKISRISSKNLSERIGSEMEVKELNVLATAFNRMLDRLQNAFDAERRLISHASHELKTPVSVIRGNCDVFLQQERSKEEYQEALRSIRSVTDNMSHLITNMLSVARLDSGILTPSDFRNISVREFIEDALKMIRPLAEKREISIVSDIPPEVRIMGDRVLLTEAFLNLISNAVKYNREHGMVDLAAWERNGNVHISVRDTGSGISEDEKERIFERFYRSASARHAEGTGLGLSIAQGIIETHNGKIRVESTPGKGSTFTVILPSPHSNDASFA